MHIVMCMSPRSSASAVLLDIISAVSDSTFCVALEKDRAHAGQDVGHPHIWLHTCL